MPGMWSRHFGLVLLFFALHSLHSMLALDKFLVESHVTPSLETLLITFVQDPVYSRNLSIYAWWNLWFSASTCFCCSSKSKSPRRIRDFSLRINIRVDFDNLFVLICMVFYFFLHFHQSIAPETLDCGQFSGAISWGLVPGLLCSYSDFVVAVTAVNRSAGCGRKGHFGILATLSTDHWIHLARWCLGVTAVAVANIALLLFSCLTACRTALGSIGVTLGCEEFLLFHSEIERGAAIEANDGFLLKTHMDDLLLKTFGKLRSSNPWVKRSV